MEPGEAKEGSQRTASGRFFGWLALGALLAVVLTFLCEPGGLLYSLEARSLDLRFRWRNTLELPTDVVIVGIDEQSLRDLGRWPWDRIQQARLIDQIAKDRPVAIGLDIILSESQSGGTDDRALAESIRRAGNVVLAAHVGDEQTPAAQKAQAGALAVEPQIVTAQNLLPLMPAVVPPLAEFRQAAAGVGVLADKPDPDLVIRRAFFLVGVRGQEGKFYPTFPLVLAARTQRWDYGTMQFNLAREAALSEADKIILDRAGSAQINFLQPAGAVKPLSFSKVARGEFPPGTFTGKTVLVGLTAAGLGDVYPTPLGEMPGVEIHAQTLQNLVHNLFLETAAFPTAVSLALLLGLIGAVAAGWLRPLVGLAVVVLVAVIYATLGMYEFEKLGMVWPALAPTGAMLLSFGVIAVFRLSTEEAGRRRLREEFGRYAPPQVVARLDAGTMRERSAGTLRDVSALFADVRGFTAWSASASPRDVVAVLNTYYESMTELAFDLEGTVDNIMGDEIFVTFNVLDDHPDHPQRAAHLALNMLRALEGLNQRWLAQGTLQEPLRIGVGINSGEALVGNLGSSVRTQYTCLGQTINLASRLQALNKELGTSILTTREVAERLAGQFVTRDRGQQSIRGHPEPVEVVEIAGRAQDGR
jgi:adenylate cyclase